MLGEAWRGGIKGEVEGERVYIRREGRGKGWAFRLEPLYSYSIKVLKSEDDDFRQLKYKGEKRRKKKKGL